MANSPFDPHSAPTVIDQAAFRRDDLPPPPPPPRPPAAPKSIGEILSGAFDLYKKHAVTFIITAAVALGPVYLVKDGLVALFAAPAAVAGASLEADSARLKDLQEKMQAAGERGDQAEVQRLAQEQLQISMNAMGKSAGALAGFFAMLVGLLLTIPLIIFANYLAQAALVVAVADASREGGSGWGGAWKSVASNLGGLLLTTFLVAVGVAVGTVMCVLPGVVFAVLCAFTAPIVLLEGKSGVEAIKRSIAYFKADVGRTLIVLVVFAIVTGIAHFVGGLFVPDRFVFLDMLVSDLVSIVVTPIPIIGLVLLFQDIQRTKMSVGDDEIRSQEDRLLPAPI